MSMPTILRPTLFFALCAMLCLQACSNKKQPIEQEDNIHWQEPANGTIDISIKNLQNFVGVYMLDTSLYAPHDINDTIGWKYSFSGVASNSFTRFSLQTSDLYSPFPQDTDMIHQLVAVQMPSEGMKTVVPYGKDQFVVLMSRAKNGYSTYLLSLWQQVERRMKLLSIGNKTYQHYDNEVGIDSLVEIKPNDVLIVLKSAQIIHPDADENQTVVALRWEFPSKITVIGVKNIYEETEYAGEEIIESYEDERVNTKPTTSSQLTYALDLAQRKFIVTVTKKFLKTNETKVEREEWPIGN